MLWNARGFSGFGGSWRHLFVVTGVALFAAGACGDSDKPPPAGDGPGVGNRGSGAVGGTGAQGGSGAEGGSSGTAGTMGGENGEGGVPSIDPRAPIVVITSPEHLDHPDDGAVLVDPDVEVICEARQSGEPGSEPVDAATVVLQMLDADGEVVDEKPGVETDPSVFSAPFIVTSQPNGPVSFRCIAADTSDVALLGSDTNQTFVDHGPAIDVAAPLPDSAHALFGAVAFAFTVTPDPLVADDAGAEVDRVTLDVVGVRIALDEQDPGEFRASVNLADTDMFPDTPSTVRVTIEARNVRDPARGVRTLTYSFVLDGEGPDITITSPLPEDVVGGEVPLRFTVTDELSEVAPETVAVTINQAAPVYFDPAGPWTRNGTDFVYRFDTTQISGSVAQATINIDAADIAGNASAGETLLVYLDNQPPIVDLDPPLIREFAEASPNNFCSVAFDPVGPAAADDLQGILQAQRFRALVWADTNKAPGQSIFFHSPTDESSVYLYVRDRPGPTRPLLVDTDNDNVCDDLAVTGLPDQRLNPLPPAPGSWFGPIAGDPPGSPMIPTGCVYQDLTTVTDTQCMDRSDIGRVISHDMDTRPPVIYALGSALGGPGAACAGVDWEIGFAQEGWVCVAGRAEDLVGNVGVSAPLRLCYDDGLDPPPDCSGTPPSCTDGCTLRPVPVIGPFNPDWLFDPL